MLNVALVAAASEVPAFPRVCLALDLERRCEVGSDWTLSHCKAALCEAKRVCVCVYAPASFVRQALCVRVKTRVVLLSVILLLFLRPISACH